MRHCIAVVAFVLMFAVGSVAAQQAPPTPPAAEPAAQAVAAPDKAPEVPQEVKAAIDQMRGKVNGYQLSMAVLQEKIDGINAEYSRLLGQLQIAGWVLDQRTLTYTKPEPPKTAPPAPAAAAPTTKK